MVLKYRSEKDISEQIKELKKWMDETINLEAEGMSDFFTKRIGGYEDIHLKNWIDDYKYIPSLIPENTKELLDLGCGTGLELDEIYIKYPKLKVTGIDLCKAMLEKLHQKHKEKNIELINADYFSYPFKKKKYDVIISVLSLHHFEYEKKKNIYKKIFNALPENGRYIECDYMAVNDEYEKLCLDYYKKRRENSGISADEFVHIDIPLTIEHQIELMKEAGFKSIKIKQQPFSNSANTVFLKCIR